jgi:hypothetical protein
MIAIQIAIPSGRDKLIFSSAVLCENSAVIQNQYTVCFCNGTFDFVVWLRLPGFVFGVAELLQVAAVAFGLAGFADLAAVMN